MPLYEFQCEACASRFERIQKYSDPLPEVCPTCGKGPVRKLLSSPAIQFKGSGFYITDYAKKSSPGESRGSKDSKDSKESKDTKESKDSKDTGASAASTAAPNKPDKKD